MKKVIVITGGIASGKSYIMKLMSDFGYPTIKSDDIARDIMKQEDFLSSIRQILGKESFELKEEIESNEKLLDIIETMIYPHIDKIRREFIEECHGKNLVPAIEIPLFFEKSIRDNLSDYDLVVISAICGKEVQMTRAAIRNKNISSKLLNIIISRQISDEERVARSNFVIYTLSKKSVVKKQLNEILRL
jgi:dephospho-CoA kinase